jgi:WD40 repeat protein
MFGLALAAVLGALAGPFGAALAFLAALVRKRFGRFVVWVGMAAGALVTALVAGLVAAVVLYGSIYAGWMYTYRRHEVGQMRTESREPVHSLKGDFQEVATVAKLESMAVSPDGQMLAYAAKGQVNLWDLAQNAPLGPPLTGHTSTVFSLDFSADGRWLVSGSHDQGVIVWSVLAAEQHLVLQGHRAAVRCVAVSPDGALLASGDLDGTIILWDLTSGEEIARVENGGDHTWWLEFSPDGELLAACTGGFGRAVRLWDVVQRESAGGLDLPHPFNGFVRGVSFSPDGKLLAGSASNGPVVWDVKTREPLGAVRKTTTYDEIDFSPDGRWIVSLGEALHLWDAATREPVGTLTRPSPASYYNALFLPDGRLLAWYSHGPARTQIGVWTIETP